MNTKIEHVKSFFAQPEPYLKNDFNIRIRAEVVKGFVGDNIFKSILDIGCGNGAISLPLLRYDNHLTLLDFSSKMLSNASTRIPPEFTEHVEMINDDFMHAEFPFQSYELILCLGVLAHVDSPADVIGKLVSLLKSNGSIIVQITDSQHPVNYIFKLYAKIRNAPPESPYPLNKLSSSKLVEIFGKHGLELVNSYRYNVSVPGTGRIFTNNSSYKFIRRVYGTHAKNHLSWLGREGIFHFRKLDTVDG